MSCFGWLALRGPSFLTQRREGREGKAKERKAIKVGEEAPDFVRVASASPKLPIEAIMAFSAAEATLRYSQDKASACRRGLVAF